MAPPRAIPKTWPWRCRRCCRLTAAARPPRTCTGARLADVRGGQRTWEVHDALGSVRQVLNDQGSAFATQQHDAWGVPSTVSARASFGFTGEVQDARSGLVYLRARWYDANDGRFVSRDPYAGVASVPSSQHPYQYALNNPVLQTDPSGRCVGYLWGDPSCQFAGWNPRNWNYSDGLDALQRGLDVVGLFPGLGEPADLLNALISYHRGNCVEALLSLAAAVPFLGWGATGVKYADEVVGVADDAAAYIDDVVGGADEAAGVGDEVAGGSDEAADAADEVRAPCPLGAAPSGKGRGLAAPLMKKCGIEYQQMGGFAEDMDSKGFHLDVVDPKTKDRTGELLLEPKLLPDGTINISVNGWSKLKGNVTQDMVEGVETLLRRNPKRGITMAQHMADSFKHSANFQHRVREGQLIRQALENGRFVVVPGN